MTTSRGARATLAAVATIVAMALTAVAAQEHEFTLSAETYNHASRAKLAAEATRRCAEEVPHAWLPQSKTTRSENGPALNIKITCTCTQIEGFFPVKLINPGADGGNASAAECLAMLEAGTLQIDRASVVEAGPLHDAAKENDATRITALLKAGTDPNATDIAGYTPLAVAAAAGHTAAVTALLAGGTDPYIEDREWLTALHWAAYEGHTPAVAALIDAGVDPNRESSAGVTPLLMAAMSDSDSHPPPVTALLDAGADPDAATEDGYTALHEAAGYGRSAAVTALLAAGADPEPKADTNFPDSRGDNTPLHMAAFAGYDDAVTALLNGGADPNVTTRMQGTALMFWAWKHSNTAGAVALLDAGADPNAKDAAGYGALHMAALNGHVAVMLALLDAGADPDAETREGHTPIALAEREGQVPAMATLRSFAGTR